jgi:hypothetical protein
MRKGTIQITKDHLSDVYITVILVIPVEGVHSTLVFGYALFWRVEKGMVTRDCMARFQLEYSPTCSSIGLRERVFGFCRSKKRRIQAE